MKQANHYYHAGLANSKKIIHAFAESICGYFITMKQIFVKVTKKKINGVINK